MQLGGGFWEDWLTNTQKGCNIWPQVFELRNFCQSNWPKPLGPYPLSGWIQNRESDSKCLDKPQKIETYWLPGGKRPCFRSTLWNTYLVCALRRHCCMRNEVSVSVSCPFPTGSSEASLLISTMNRAESSRLLLLQLSPATWFYCFGIWSMLNFRSRLLGPQMDELAFWSGRHSATR